MNIQTEKLDLIAWISKLDDKRVIERLREIMNSYTQVKDWADTLKKEEIESIERGLKDLEEGKVHSHETARGVYAKHL